MITDKFHPPHSNIFLNLSSPSIITDFNSNSLEKKVSQNENSQLNFFFSEADQRLMKFTQAGYCNVFGKLNENYQSLSLCPDFRNDDNPYLTINEKINELLILKQVIKAPKHSSFHLSINTTLVELFNHLIESFSKENQEKTNQNLLFYLVEIFLIGSSILPLIGIEYFENLALHHFSTSRNNQPGFSEDEIKSWFQNDKIKKLFVDQSNDLDTRTVISSHNIHHICQLSNALLNFIAQKIPDDAGFLLQDNAQPYDFKNGYLLKSGAIRHRKIVEENHTNYTIIAFNTINKPIDFNCVGSKFNPITNQFQPTLENAHLSSLNSLTIPLLQFLFPVEPLKKVVFTSDYGIQVLLDILFDCSTPTTYNHYGWRYFLKKNTRMLGPHDEKKMIDELLEFRKKNEFQSISRHRYLPSEADTKTLGGFLFLLLANDFSKIDGKIANEPYQLSEFIFRACLSLSLNSNITDQDLHKLWDCVNHYYWKVNGQFSKSDSIYTCLKEAMLDDKIPFRINSAFIKLLAYLFDSNSATTHCNHPVIDLKTPFSALLPITLHKDIDILTQFFSTHSFPHSFQKIYKAFVQSSNFSVKGFHLSSYFNTLDIHPKVLMQTVQMWIKTNSPINLIGSHIYFTLYEQAPDSKLLIYILQNLPSIFKFLESVSQKKFIIESILTIAKTGLFEAIPLIENLANYEFQCMTDEQWFSLLLDTNSSFSTAIAYKIFKKNHHRNNYINENTPNKLLKGLMKSNFHQACQTHLLLLHKQEVISYEVEKEIFSLLRTYEEMKVNEKIQYLFDLIKVLETVIKLPLIQKFKNNITFAKYFSAFLKNLFITAPLEKKGDELLINGCHFNLLTKSQRQFLWIFRIKQFTAQKEFLSAIFKYQTAIENKWIQADQFIEKNDLDPILKIFSSLLIEQPDFLKKNTQILLLVFKIIPETNFSHSEKLIYDFIHQLLISFKTKKEDFQIESDFLLMDEILLNDHLVSLSKSNPKSWSCLFLDYINNTIDNFTRERKLNLCLLYEFCLLHPYNFSQLIHILERMNNHSCISKTILNMISNNGDEILKGILKYEDFDTLKIMILFLNQHQIKVLNYERFLWILLKQEINSSNDLDLKILKIFLDANVDILKTIIFPSDTHDLLKVLHLIVLKKNQNNEIYHWMNDLLDFFIMQEKHSILFKELFEIYSLQLLELEYYQSALNILIKMSHNELFQDSKNLTWKALELFLNLTSRENLLSTISNKETLLLNSNKVPFLIALKIIKKITNTNKLQIKDVKIILEFIRPQKNQLQLWVILWENLYRLKNSAQAHEMIVCAWESNRIVLHELTCVSKKYLKYRRHLLECLKVISHDDLKGFLNQIEWLFPFCTNVNTSSLAKQVFCLMIESILPFIGFKEDLNLDLFEKLENQKIIFYEMIKKNLDQEENNEWLNWTEMIDLTLFNQLKNSNDYLAIYASCLILRKLFSNKPSDKKIASLVLQTIHHYIKNSHTIGSNIDHQNVDEKKYLFQLRNIICQFAVIIGTYKVFTSSKINEILVAALKNINTENCFITFSLSVSLHTLNEDMTENELLKIKKNLFKLIPHWLEQDDEKFKEDVRSFIKILTKKVQKDISIDPANPSKNILQKTIELGNWFLTSALKFGCGASLSVFYKNFTWNRSERLNFLNSIFWYNKQEYETEIIRRYENVSNLTQKIYQSSLPFSVKSILNAQCPIDTFNNNFQLFIDTCKNKHFELEQSTATPINFLQNIILQPLQEGIIFRQLLQKAFFKNLKSHSKYFTEEPSETFLAFVSVILAACATTIIMENDPNLDNFFLNTTLGFLHEIGGLPLSCGAHAMHHFTAYSIEAFLKCYPSL